MTYHSKGGKARAAKLTPEERSAAARTAAATRWANRPSFEHRANPINLTATVKFLNGLHARGVIGKYVLIGGIAAMAYSEPRMTKDIDAVVHIDDTFKEYPSMWTKVLAEAGGAHTPGGFTILVGPDKTPLDLSATGGDKLMEECLEKAVAMNVDGEIAWIAPPEYLVLMSLNAFRPEVDYGRITALYPQCANKVRRLLKRFDHEGKLLRNLERLLDLNA